LADMFCGICFLLPSMEFALLVDFAFELCSIDPIRAR
jgi:hypothetical protein